MNIISAKEKIEARLGAIFERAKEAGLDAKLDIRFVGKDFLNDETSEDKIRFISAEVKIFADGDESASISFGACAECMKGFCDEEKAEEDIVFAEERAEEFFAELSEAEDKEAFLKERIALENELREKAAEEIRRTVRSSWLAGIAALCLGAAVLLVAAIVTVIVV